VLFVVTLPLKEGAADAALVDNPVDDTCLKKHEFKTIRPKEESGNSVVTRNITNQFSLDSPVKINRDNSSRI
jgi:hypothetical protein